MGGVAMPKMQRSYAKFSDLDSEHHHIRDYLLRARNYKHVFIYQ